MLSGFAVRLGRLADAAPERFEGLPGKLAMKFADLSRLGYRALIGSVYELGLNFHRLVERADAAELLEKGPELLGRFSCVVAIGLGYCLQADRRGLGRGTFGRGRGAGPRGG